MFVSLSQQTEKMGERMNGVMNHRRGGVLRKMIMRTDPVISQLVRLGKEAVERSRACI
jgi:hypothetical protein